MKVSARWLREMIPGLALSPEDMAETLALRGAPVESIASPGAALGDVVVAKVLTTAPHPNADRLTLCTVDGGEGVVPVVCGAPNVRAGGWYPFVPVGATLPGGLVIKKAKIRGETSQGMLCSAKELGLGGDHSGILALEGEFEPGESFVGAIGLDDATLDVETTVNRGDLLSHLGVAREIASAEGRELLLPDIAHAPDVKVKYVEGSPAVKSGSASVRIDDADLCHRYLGAVIRGVRVGPSPTWLQERLRGAGARPINNVVDATNYVMLELGQPLHAFDLGRLAGSAVVVRRARASESSFTTLDREERKLATDMLMICDGEKPVAIAGVMGGLHSEVEADTSDVLLECALFEPKSTRATRKALGMSTDASYRYERGVDPEGLRRALERCVSIIVAVAGGEVDGPVMDCVPVRFETPVVQVRLSRIQHLLGVGFDSRAVRALLAPLGFEVVGEKSGALDVRVPGFRSYDVRREVDLIEEVARTHGYDAFPADLGPYRAGTVPDHPLFQLEDDLRGVLVERGLFEAHTLGFSEDGEGDLEVTKPLAAAERFMRRSLVPSLLRGVEHNFAQGTRDIRLFEIGTGFRKGDAGQPPHESTYVAAVLTGLREPAHWSREDEAFEVWDLKGLLEEVAASAYGGAARVVPGSADATLDSTRSFTVMNGEAMVGRGGLVAPGVVDAPVWAGAVWALEVELPPEGRRANVVSHRRLPSQPPIDRDLALLVPHALASEAVAHALARHGGDLLEDVALFDVYAGEGVPADVRSLAFRLRFRAPERTLKDTEVDRAVEFLLAKLEEELGVQPRG